MGSYSLCLSRLLKKFNLLVHKKTLANRANTDSIWNRTGFIYTFVLLCHYVFVGNLVFTSAGGASTLVVNPSGVSTVNSGLSTTAASFAAINRKMQNVAQNVVSMGQVAAVGDS